MQCSTLILTFIAGLALCECQTHVPTPKQSVSQPTSVVELITKAQTDIMKLGTDLSDVLIRPNQEAVVEALKERSSVFVTTVQKYIADMNNKLKAKGSEVQDRWDDIRKVLTKATEDISAQIPLAKEEITKLQGKFVDGLNAIVKQSELVVKTVSADAEPIKEDVANLAKMAVELTVQATKQLKAEIEQIVPKPKA
ncbi:uncharacterized protein LOC124406700 [Diprion similis]|uniref:uncharacterized protein LOC124406700 n=1 Tax=Diprion similis TaxID=362088 RepID=UPI001EF825A1|nr:uncharacterized protein LOC124406700 [Diprion similis]